MTRLSSVGGQPFQQIGLAPTQTTGTGSSASVTVPMPAGFVPVIGRKYLISGVLFVRDDSGVIVLSTAVDDMVVKLTNGPAWTQVRAGESTDSDIIAGVASFFFLSGDRPRLGVSGANLVVAYKSVLNASAVIEFDGVVADFGMDS